MPIFLKAAINGARSKSEHAGLPVTVEAIAHDAQEVIAAGAHAIHFHVRDSAGRESLSPDDVERCIVACRTSVPTAPLGVSTGAWIVPSLPARLALIRAWRTQPDFASVNFAEEGAEEVAHLLQTRGVSIELGLSSPTDAARALATGWDKRCIRILLEPGETDVALALATVKAIEQTLGEAHTAAPCLLHGSEVTVWPLLMEAVRRGYQCRVGFEDTLRLPTGELAVSNAQLVSIARALMGSDS